MKIFRTNSDIKLEKQSQLLHSSGNKKEFKWILCYRVNEDGSSISLSIGAAEGEHRQSGEHRALLGIFGMLVDSRGRKLTIRLNDDDETIGFRPDDAGPPPPSDSGGDGVLSGQGVSDEMGMDTQEYIRQTQR